MHWDHWDYVYTKLNIFTYFKTLEWKPFQFWAPDVLQCYYHICGLGYINIEVIPNLIQSTMRFLRLYTFATLIIQYAWHILIFHLQYHYCYPRLRLRGPHFRGSKLIPATIFIPAIWKAKLVQILRSVAQVIFNTHSNGPKRFILASRIQDIFSSNHLKWGNQ